MLIDDIKNLSASIKKCRNNFELEMKKLNSLMDSELDLLDKELKKGNSTLNEINKKIAKIEEDIYKEIEKQNMNKIAQRLNPGLEFFNVSINSSKSNNSLNQYEEELKKCLRQKDEKLALVNGGLYNKNQEKIKEIEKQSDKLKQEYEKENKRYVDKVKFLFNEVKSQSVKDYKFGATPSIITNYPSKILIGNSYYKCDEIIKEIVNEDNMYLPISIDVRHSGNILLEFNTNDIYDSNLEDVCVGVMMKYMESFPFDSLKIAMYSSVFSSLEKVNGLYSGILKNKINICDEPATNQYELSSLLSKVKQHGQMIKQKLLENNCSNIFEMYEQNIKTDCMQLVFIQDAFREMTEENLRELYGCLTGYYNCGVRFFIIDTFDDELYKNKSQFFKETLKQIKNKCNCFVYKNKKCHFTSMEEISLVKVDYDFNQQDIYNFCIKYKEATKTNEKKYVDYESINFGIDEEGLDDYETISIPIGIAAPDIWKMSFSVTKNPLANLVIGVPGTGKSSLIDSLILNGAIKYSPDDVIFHFLDFKDGSSSFAYTDNECKVPHVKVVSQNNKPDEANIVLSNIFFESENRIEKFKSLSIKTGTQIKNIAEYNRIIDNRGLTMPHMPRLIIIIDECQFLFEEDDLAKRCEDLIRKGRSQGIHLVLATQALSRKMYNTTKYIDGIYCFDVAKEDAEQLLPKKYSSILSTEVPKGSYSAFASNDNGNNCSKVKIAFDGGKMSYYAKCIREKWDMYSINTEVIGNKDKLFIDEILQDKFDYYKEVISSEDFVVPVGENYSDHSLSTITFRNEKQSAVFMCGTNEEISNSLNMSIVVSSLINNANLYVIDASNSQSLFEYCNFIKEDIGYSSGLKINVANEKKYMEYLEAVNDIYEERMKNIREHYHPLVFIVNGGHNIVEIVNNEKMVIESQNDSPSFDSNVDFSNLSFKEKLQYKKTTIRPSEESKMVFGNETLKNLISAAYKVNIFVCFSIDSINGTDDKGEAMFKMSHKNIIRQCNFKFLFKDISDASNFMENTYKDNMLNGINENMAVLSYKQRDYSKIRVINYSDNFDITQFMKGK